MRNAEAKRLTSQAYTEGNGTFSLAPTWVPRSFCIPGRRLELALGDLYALGTNRGGIDERWLSSVTRADNPRAPEDEGLSYIVLNDRKVMTLKEAIQVEGELIFGKDIMEKYGGWKILTKFFNN